MSEFTDLQDQLDASRQDYRKARSGHLAALERLAKQQRKIQAAERLGEQSANMLGRLREEERRIKENLEDKAGLFLQADSLLRENLAAFEPFSDPTQRIEEFDDSFPILLFPVRIETRFKKLTEVNDRPRHQLWLRIFPDDILIDTFEDLPAEVEVANVRQYWVNRWIAGGVESELRAAWKALISSHGSGRAHWLIQKIAPVTDDPEIDAEPVKQEGEHLLVIATSARPPLNESQLVESYWQDVVSGIPAADALAELTDELGPVRAEELITEYVPENIDTPVPGDSTEVRVVWLKLPDLEALDTQLQPWSQPARASLLPERFVVLGFNGREQSLLQIGNPVPAELLVGPDPSAAEEDQLSEEDGELDVPDQLKWLTDFDQAIAQGMGMKIDLTANQYQSGFDRLFVLGVRLGANPEQARLELEQLLVNHQRSSSGLSLLRQGTPTNNVDADESGYTWIEDADISYDHYFGEHPEDEAGDWRNKTDGRRFAEALGLDPEVIKGIPNYFATDQCEARAMNEALWPTTLGYYMESMLNGVFDDAVIDQARDYFNRYVLGRGVIPAFQVADQPYGVLTATRFTNMSWLERDRQVPRRKTAPFLQRLYAVIKKAHETWDSLATRVSKVDADSADAHQALLDIIGLHPTSAEHYRRVAQSFEEFFNHWKLSAFFGHSWPNGTAATTYQTGLQFLETFGYKQGSREDFPELLSKFFFAKPDPVGGPLIDEPPISESELIRATHESGDNYLQWLITASKTSHDMLRKQEGFEDNRPPRALLYLMLRHALDLGFIQTSIQLHREFSLLDDSEIRAYQAEPKFFHVADEAVDGNSRDRNTWELLYKTEAAITNDPELSIGEFISRTLTVRDPYLNRQIAALEHLKDRPTARLERAFVEHLDCCSYRLDAWWLGLLAVQLEVMRTPRVNTNTGATLADHTTGLVNRGSESDGARLGSYLGAFGWVEDLRPDDRTLAPARLSGDLQAIFDKPGQAPLFTDDRNFGYIHAPSLNHAVTAAVLRNGYLANATPDEPDLLAINLTSSRVRTAMDVIEGMRNGQSLGALLGYQLERGLHDAEGLFLDSIIYELRTKFPLAANRLASTRTDAPIEAIEARNVVDGLALIEHIEETRQRNYPFGFDDLPEITDQTALDAIDAEVSHIQDINDAVADLAMAESVYQVVQGNYDRAASTAEAYAKGNFPPTPEVVQTPRSGVTLTHRVGIHLQSGLNPASGTFATPRAKGEPAVDAWLSSLLPPMDDIVCEATYVAHSTGAETTLPVSAGDLGLSAVDLVYMLNRDGEQEMGALEDLIVWFVAKRPDTRQDQPVRIQYLVKQPGKFSFFELTPLLADLHGMLLRSRPLKATDMRRQNEAAGSEDTNATIRERKITSVRDLLNDRQASLNALVTGLDTLLAGPDEAAVLTNIVSNIDSVIVNYSDVVGQISLFGLPHTGTGFVWDWRRQTFAKLLALVDKIIAFWARQKVEFNNRLGAFGSLDPEVTDQNRIQYLIEVGLLLNSQPLVPASTNPNPNDLLSPLNNILTDFEAAETDLAALRAGTQSLGALYQGLQSQAAAIDQHYPEGLDLADTESAMQSFITSLRAQGQRLADDITERIDNAETLLASPTASSAEKRNDELRTALRALTSEDFLVLSEFTTSPEQAAEWESARGDSLALQRYLTDQGKDFPVDEWLYGIARVREKMNQVENATIHLESLFAKSLALEPCQFPYRPDDFWLALEYPDQDPVSNKPFVIDEDKLLYTAHYSAGFSTAGTQCGLLIDEWTEVVPTTVETTGLTFHYDRPNSEPPQTLLLALPGDFTGNWAWQDLVQTLHETLDFARLRAVEPAHLDSSPFGRFLPALISKTTRYPVMAMLDLAQNNGFHLKAELDQ